MQSIRALLDTRKNIAARAFPRRSLFLLARSFRSKSRVWPFVERSAMMRSALDKVSVASLAFANSIWHGSIRSAKVIACAIGQLQECI